MSMVCAHGINDMQIHVQDVAWLSWYILHNVVMLICGISDDTGDDASCACGDAAGCVW